jgi:hypothetical protein
VSRHALPCRSSSRRTCSAERLTFQVSACTTLDMCAGARSRVWRVWRAGGGGRQPLRQPTLQQPGAPPPRDDQLQPGHVHAHAAQRPGQGQPRRRCGPGQCISCCAAGPVCGTACLQGAPDHCMVPSDHCMVHWTRLDALFSACRHARRFLRHVLTALIEAGLPARSSSPPLSRPAASRIVHFAYTEGTAPEAVQYDKCSFCAL